ncbi:DsbA family protein [Colwelliaceae bacterium BS250]
MNNIKLIYVYDPMCSWCWGYRPTWQTLQEKLKDKTDIECLVGGLAADSDAPMPESMQLFLQQTWQKISDYLGTEFNFDFWRNCQPKRSTYPACRAVLIARDHGLEQEMYFAIQQAYYLHGQNPSEPETLTDLAQSIGIDKGTFAQRLQSIELNRRLAQEISTARALPINGFPSLVLAINEQYFSVPVDYQHWQTSYQVINQLIERHNR